MTINNNLVEKIKCEITNDMYLEDIYDLVENIIHDVIAFMSVEKKNEVIEIYLEKLLD